MPNIADWIMIAITAVYVIATIAICIFNFKSAQASQNQIKESQRQFAETNRPHIVVGIRIESNYFMCIYIKNIGNDVADNIEIKFNSDWLNLITVTYFYGQFYIVIMQNILGISG